MKNLLSRIITDPKVMVGKPVIKGTRIPVQLVLDLLAQGVTHEEIIKEYPHILKDDIYACLLFAQQALDNSIFALLPPGNQKSTIPIPKEKRTLSAVKIKTKGLKFNRDEANER